MKPNSNAKQMLSFWIDFPIQGDKNVLSYEPWHVISNNVVFLTSVDSDEPVQPPFKPRNPKWCSVKSLRVIEYSSD